jgi:hypothetical protein
MRRAEPAKAATTRAEPAKVATFEAVVVDGHKGAAVEVPFDPVAEWKVTPGPIRPGRHGVAVGATVNGVAFDGFIVGRQRRFYLRLDEAVLEAAGVAVGDRVAVRVQAK